MSKYLNIASDNSTVYSNDKKYSKSILLSMFQNIITSNNIAIEEFEKQEGFYKTKIKTEDNFVYEFKFIIKNVTNAGWIDKPSMKRIQVKNIFDNVSESNNKTVVMIIGIYNFDNNPMIIAWNPYEYNKHATIRSCYVTTDIMQYTYQKGFHAGTVSSQKIWLVTPNNFSKFIEEYFLYMEKVNKDER